MRLKMASRKSDLARIQLHTVGEFLQKKINIQPEYIYRESFGDKNLDIDLSGSENKGLFTQDFYQALLDKEVDLVVHSWKDLPIEDKETTIVMTLEREDVRDVLLVKKKHLQQIKQSQKINILTSSPRREYFLSEHLNKLYPVDLKSVEFTAIRGNIPTRLSKLLASEADALVIAKAALDRMLSVEDSEFTPIKTEIRNALEQCQFMVLPLNYFPSAAAQGALAVEVLKGTEIEKTLRQLNFSDQFELIKKERATLKKYGGGCHSKLGINYLSRSYGELKFFSYEDKSNEFVHQVELGLPTQFPKVNAKLLWPQKGEVPASRSSVDVDLIALKKEAALWVTKESAFPTDYQPADEQCVWTSGLITWQKLAKKGVWVNGSAESLGEREEMRLEHLLGSDLMWAKLSHVDGAQTEKKLIPIYKVKWNFTTETFKGAEHFYWMSGEMFKQAMAVAPNIIDKHHYCGPGHTFDEIKKYVNNLTVCLNYNQWLKDISQ